MADKNKYDSDTLRQQRKAREEFLELKKIQSGEIAAPPPPSAEAEIQKTFKEKSKNFWFYYRHSVFAVIFIAVVVTICVAQCVSRPDYDLGLVLYTASPVSDTDAKKMAEYFEKYCEDINGNGKVNIQIYNCSYAANDSSQFAYTVNTKVQAILTAEYEAVLFITDDVTYERLNSISNGRSLFEKDEIILGDSFNEFCESSNQLPLPQGLRLSRRIISETLMQNNKKAAACYEASGKIIEKVAQENG